MMFNTSSKKRPHPVDRYVGKRVRQRRLMLGFSQQQLGEAVGIKFQQIQKYETGANRISASRLWDIAQTLDVPITFFFEGYKGTTFDDAKDNDTVDGDLLTDKEALELVRAYYAIPEHQRRKLYDLAHALREAAQ